MEIPKRSLSPRAISALVTENPRYFQVSIHTDVFREKRSMDQCSICVCLTDSKSAFLVKDFPPKTFVLMNQLIILRFAMLHTNDFRVCDLNIWSLPFTNIWIFPNISILRLWVDLSFTELCVCVFLLLYNIQQRAI